MRITVILGTLLLGLVAGHSVGQIVPDLIYYKFNEGGGTTTANHALPGAGSPFGTINGGLTFGPGRFGSGIVGASLPAAANNVTTGYAMNLQGQSWTLEFWFQPSGTTSLQYLYGNSQAGGGTFRGWCGAAPGSNMLISGNGLATNSVPGSVPAPGTWVHYAWVFDASVAPPTVTPYLNGVPLAPIAQTGALTLNTGSLIVGGYANSNGVLGTLDEFRLWQRVRTAAEIAASYNVELVGENVLSATTSGGGVGNLSLSLTTITAGVSEGWICLTAATTTPLGSGPLLGIYPDATTWFGLFLPPAPGNPFHFLTGFPGLFPDQPFTVGPGTLSSLAGQTFDFVALVVTPGPIYAGRSQVVRLTW